jgi:hypothetical protein
LLIEINLRLLCAAYHCPNPAFGSEREVPMISREDCIALCGLDADEIDAIAEHEHLGDVQAAALAQYLLHASHGAEKIRGMIVDDIRTALNEDRTAHAAQLLAVLRHFLHEHPEAKPHKAGRSTA